MCERQIDMKIFYLFKYELKPKFLFPVILPVSLVTVFLYLTSSINLYEFKLLNQGFLIPIFGIWIISVYKEFYEDSLKELLYCYPITIFQLGVKKVLIMICFSFILIFPMTLFDENIYHSLLLYLSQISLFISFGFLLITVTKNFEVAMTFILLYVSTEFLTNGSFVPWPHIFVFEASLLEHQQYLLNKGVITLFYSSMCLYIGQLFLSIDKKE